jgi:hypothetical protein
MEFAFFGKKFRIQLKRTVTFHGLRRRIQLRDNQARPSTTGIGRARASTKLQGHWLVAAWGTRGLAPP